MVGVVQDESAYTVDMVVYFDTSKLVTAQPEEEGK
jgi:hypothetical protein